MDKRSDDYERYINSKTEKIISRVFVALALIVFLVNIAYIYLESLPHGGYLIPIAVFPTMLFFKYFITSYGFWLKFRKVEVRLVISIIGLGLLSFISWYIL